MRYVFKYFELNQFITTTATYNNLFFPSLHSIMLKLFKNSLIIFFCFLIRKIRTVRLNSVRVNPENK